MQLVPFARQAESEGLASEIILIDNKHILVVFLESGGPGLALFVRILVFFEGGGSYIH